MTLGVSLIVLLGVFQGLILSVVLLLSKKNKRSNRVFSLSILLVSIALLFAYFHINLDYKAFPFFIKTTLGFPLLFIPLLYIYVKINSKLTYHFNFSSLKYFVPFFVFIAYNAQFFLGSKQNKIAYFERENLYNSELFIDKLEIVLINFTLFCFALAIIRAVIDIRTNYQKQLSNYSEKIFFLLRLLAYATLLFTGIALVLSGLHLVNITYPSFFDYLSALGSTLLIYFIGYYTLLHPEIFYAHNLEIVSSKASNKITNSKNNEELENEYFENMVQAMEDDLIFEDSNLNLITFSKKLKIPSYLVSKIINKKTQLNFYNFVNGYRIERVKSDLLTIKKPHIMQVAYSAGFNSKSSFYNYFNKHTGVSPLEFIKNSPDKAK